MLAKQLHAIAKSRTTLCSASLWNACLPVHYVTGHHQASHRLAGEQPPLHLIGKTSLGPPGMILGFSLNQRQKVSFLSFLFFSRQTISFVFFQVGKDAVVVEADAMKSMDVIYKQLSKMSSFQHEPDVSSYVHEYSTKQAEALFVSAINRQKDVIFDGTMMWAPFVEQTIAMVRDHKRNYRRGPGYQTYENGHVTEQ